MKITNKVTFGLPKSVIRLIGWVTFLIFFVTFCLPLIFFYYLFDAQQVKQMVINQFNNKNYSVVINGSVEPRSWHGLSLFISDLTVEDKAKHKVLHVNTANFQLSWLDLIVGHYRVRRAALNGLTYYQGDSKQTNYTELLNYQNIAHSEFKNITHLSVSNFTVMNHSGTFILKDAALRIDNLEENPAFTMQFNLIKYAAKFSMQGQVSKIDDDNINLQTLTMSLSSPKYNFEIQSTGHYAYKLQELWLENGRGSVKLDNYQGVITLENALLSSYGITINNLSSTLNGINNASNKSLILNTDRLNSNDFNHFQVSQLSSKFEILSSEHNLVMDVDLPSFKFDSNFNVNSNCDVSLKYARLSHQEILFDSNLSGKCSLDTNNQLIGFQSSGKINQSPASVNLDYKFGESIPNIKLDATLNFFDASRFMANNKEKVSLYYNQESLPFNWLGSANIVANLKLNQLKLVNVALNNITTQINIDHNKLDVSNFSGLGYGGALNGTMSVTKIGESYNVDFQNIIKNINLQSAFNSLFGVSAIKGLADVVINTSAQGVNSYADLHKKLSGKINMSVNNGGFSGIDFSLFLSPENLAAFQNGAAVMTNFTSLGADFEFKDGISKAGAIKFSSPTITAKGSGVINFADTTLNYNLVIASILPHNTQNLKSVSIPIIINGNLFSPKIYIQNMTLNATKIIPSSKKTLSKKEKK